jgi:hypothetical protein
MSKSPSPPGRLESRKISSPCTHASEVELVLEQMWARLLRGAVQRAAEVLGSCPRLASPVQSRPVDVGTAAAGRPVADEQEVLSVSVRARAHLGVGAVYRLEVDGVAPAAVRGAQRVPDVDARCQLGVAPDDRSADGGSLRGRGHSRRLSAIARAVETRPGSMAPAWARRRAEAQAASAGQPVEQPSSFRPPEAGF